MRSFLQKIALVVLTGFLVGMPALSIASHEPLFKIESQDELVAFYPYTFWNKKSEGPFFGSHERLTDPVNIVFLNATIAEIRMLFLPPWHDVDGEKQILYVENKPAVTAAQLARELPDGTRFHIRLFPHENLVFGAAHLEAKNQSGGHQLISWETAEREVAIMFRGFPQDLTDKQITAVYFRGAENDGFATLVNLE